MKLLLGITCFLLAAVAHGADWTLTTADFQKRPVALQSIDENSLAIVTQGGVEPVRVPLDQFLSVDRNQPVAIADSALVLHLAGGGRLVGTPLRIDGDNIIWQTRSIGAVPASLRRAQGITRGNQPLSPEPARQQDHVRLTNGDRLDGIVADVADGNLIIQVGSDLVPVPSTAIAAVHFAATGAPAGRDQPGFQLRLADGSAVPAPTVRIEGDAVETIIADEVRRLPLSGVIAIEQVNGPVAWLSDRAPAAAIHTPFLGDAVSPRFNTNLDGQPVRLRSTRIAKAIAVHSKSQLTWDLPAGYQRFRTQYAIDGDLPHANVIVRIYLDDRVVHEQQDVTAGAPEEVIEIELGGAKQLTLEVDYGQTYDVQDRLIWIEPALIK